MEFLHYILVSIKILSCPILLVQLDNSTSSAWLKSLNPNWISLKEWMQVIINGLLLIVINYTFVGSRTQNWVFIALKLGYL